MSKRGGWNGNEASREERQNPIEDNEPREFWCDVCNTKMVEVRPGEWQHDDVGCLSERRSGES